MTDRKTIIFYQWIYSALKEIISENKSIYEILNYTQMIGYSLIFRVDSGIIQIKRVGENEPVLFIDKDGACLYTDENKTGVVEKFDD